MVDVGEFAGWQGQEGWQEPGLIETEYGSFSSGSYDVRSPQDRPHGSQSHDTLKMVAQSTVSVWISWCLRVFEPWRLCVE